MKKHLAVLLAAVLAIAPLAGCGSSPKPSTASTSPSSSGGASASAPAEMKPEKYVVMLSQAIAEYPPDGGEAKPIIQAKWEKDLGITNTDYEVILASGADYPTKLNAMMSGGDVPDIFTAKVEEFPTLVKNGVIAPVDEYVEKMPHYQKLLENPNAKASYDNLMIDGKHYGLPGGSLEGSLNSVGVNGLIMRTDWLKKLNLEAPKTLDELHDVLVAFTNNDPDGNGKKDTYGLSGNKGQMFASIFGAYGIYLNGMNSWTEVEGKLVHSTTLPQVKDVLTLLSKWYAEGLIDPDKFVIEGKQAKDKFIAGQFGAYENSVWWANDARVAWGASNPTATCALVTPPTGPEGKKGFPINPIAGAALVISANCAKEKDVNRLTQILDWVVNTDEDGGMMLVTYGVEGKHYTYDKEKDLIDTSLLGDASNCYKLGFSNPVRWIPLTDRRWIPKGDAREVDFQICGNDKENSITSAFSSAVPAMKEYPDLYSKLWDEYFTKIVTGSLPVSAFEQYVEKFNSQGGTVLTEQVNAAWAARK